MMARVSMTRIGTTRVNCTHGAAVAHSLEVS